MNIKHQASSNTFVSAVLTSIILAINLSKLLEIEAENFLQVIINGKEHKGNTKFGTCEMKYKIIARCRATSLILSRRLSTVRL